MRVTWVHPSWRDLVIERLAGDPAQRRAFLHAAELPGIALALSVGGGGEGERELPLLRDDEDWDALGDAVHRLCREAAQDELARLLGALAMALESAGDERVQHELSGTTEVALGKIARRLESEDAIWDVDLLGRWLALADRVAERPPGPSTGRTWSALRPGLIDARDPSSIARLSTWLALTELIARPLLMSDREALWRFLEELRDGEGRLTLDEESALTRIARLDDKLRPLAQWILDHRGVADDVEDVFVPPWVPEQVIEQRVRRILLDL